MISRRESSSGGAWCSITAGGGPQLVNEPSMRHSCLPWKVLLHLPDKFVIIFPTLPGS